MARRKRENTPEGFLARVDHENRTPNQCWDWKGPLNYAGYGRLLWNGQRVMAHRVMAVLVEKIPDIDASDFVSQSCGNRKCCNPGHLVIKS
jgi:hypothetical protein